MRMFLQKNRSKSWSKLYRSLKTFTYRLKSQTSQSFQVLLSVIQEKPKKTYLSAWKVFNKKSQHLMCKCYRQRLKSDQSQDLIKKKLLDDLRVLKLSNRFLLTLHFLCAIQLKISDLWETKNVSIKKTPIKWMRRLMSAFLKWLLEKSTISLILILSIFIDLWMKSSAKS